MAILKVLSCSLIFIVAAVSFIDAQLYAPRHYNIHFILHDKGDVFHGEYNVSIYIPDNTQLMYFNTENLSIIKTTVTNNTQISKENEEKVFPHRPNKFFYDTETYITTISFPYALSAGNYTLYMKFFGFFGEDGGFKTFYMNQQNNRECLAATHYHTFGIRRLFPLLKDDMHARYNISIKHHTNYTALSNMPMWEVNMDENNMQWTRFKTTPVIPVHFIAASVVHLGFILDTSQSVKLWCETSMIPHMIFAYTVVKNIAQFLDNVFPYIRKSPETNHIAIPNFHDISDEENIKFGFVLYREADIIFNQQTDDEMRKIEIVRVIGYKVVHEWFYNAIDPYKWKPWLSKGFSTFFGIYAADKTFPHFRMQDFFVVQTQHDVLHWGTKDTWPLTIKSEFNSSIKIPRYIKASIMFRMLQIIFTEEMFEFVFCVTSYLQNHYVSDTIFLDILQIFLDEQVELSLEIHYIDRITNWTQLNYYPVINVKRNYITNSLNISVDNFTNIWILVNITTKTHSDLKKSLPTLWLGPNNSYQLQTVDFINRGDWVLANLQQSGCYRVNYDAENWRRLSQCLRSNAFGKIHILDRAKIIDDAFHFLMTGQLNVTIFLDISRNLWRDKDYIVWYPMFKNLEYMSGFFAFPESNTIKKEMMQLLNEILWKIRYPNFYSDTYSQESVLIKSLRQEAARLLCAFSYYNCLAIASNELRRYLYDHRTCDNIICSVHPIWGGWKEWTFCNGLALAHNYTWMQVFDMYWNGSDYSILKFLACSQNSSIIFQYIHLMKLGANMRRVTAIDHINSFCTIVARHANNTSVLDFILDNLEEIKPKEISIITALTMIINYVYVKEHIDQVNEFLKLKKNMENMIMYVNRKLALRWLQIRSHLYEYRYLIKDFDDIFKAYDGLFN